MTSCSLEKARIHSLPEYAFYIADFLTKDEETYLLHKISSAPLPRWTQLSHRRLQTWPSALTPKTNSLIAAPLPPWLVSPIIRPKFETLGFFHDAPHGAPNHILVNEYRPGQGIMPHEDGAAYFPLVATVSLGAPIVLDLYDKQQNMENGDGDGNGKRRGNGNDDGSGNHEMHIHDRPRFRILQEPRSLLVTGKSLYTDYRHGIAETMRDEQLSKATICNWDLLGDRQRYECGSYERETRISLTYRDVLKVTKLGNTMKFLSGR